MKHHSCKQNSLGLSRSRQRCHVMENIHSIFHVVTNQGISKSHSSATEILGVAVRAYHLLETVETDVYATDRTYETIIWCLRLSSRLAPQCLQKSESAIKILPQRGKQTLGSLQALKQWILSLSLTIPFNTSEHVPAFHADLRRA